MDLECSWNNLICMISTAWAAVNTHNMNLILYYSGKVQGLSDNLDKKLWIVLHHALVKAGGHSEQ